MSHRRIAEPSQIDPKKSCVFLKPVTYKQDVQTPRSQVRGSRHTDCNATIQFTQFWMNYTIRNQTPSISTLDQFFPKTIRTQAKGTTIVSPDSLRSHIRPGLVSEPTSYTFILKEINIWGWTRDLHQSAQQVEIWTGYEASVGHLWGRQQSGPGKSERLELRDSNTNDHVQIVVCFLRWWLDLHIFPPTSITIQY